jgi:hypothetical protein
MSHMFILCLRQTIALTSCEFGSTGQEICKSTGCCDIYVQQWWIQKEKSCEWEDKQHTLDIGKAAGNKQCEPIEDMPTTSACSQILNLQTFVFNSFISHFLKSSWTRSLQTCKWNCIQIKTNRCMTDITISITSDIIAVMACRDFQALG